MGGGITGPEVRPCDGWVGEATAPSATGPDFPGRTLGSGFPTKAPAVILPRRYTRRCSGISPDTTAAGSNWILANTQPHQAVVETRSGGARELKAYHLGQKDRWNLPFAELQPQRRTGLRQGRIQQARQDYLKHLREAPGPARLSIPSLRILRIPPRRRPV